MKTMYGYAEQRYFVGMQNALEHGVGNYGGGFDEVDRLMIMEEIDDFLKASYWIGSNPLPHLRKAFPGFDWKHHRASDNESKEAWRKRFEKLLTSSDFFWPLSDDRFPQEIVIARLKTKPPPMIFYILQSFGQLALKNLELTKILTTAGARACDKEDIE